MVLAPPFYLAISLSGVLGAATIQWVVSRWMSVLAALLTLARSQQRRGLGKVGRVRVCGGHRGWESCCFRQCR